MDFPSVVTIGNFDGCHLGHQALIAKAFEISRLYKLRVITYTFDPAPQEFFLKDKAPQRLFNRSLKQRSLAELGVEEVIFQDFDQDFSQVTHQAFYQEHLRVKLNAQAIVTGENFKFGNNRQGDAKFLQNAGEKDGVIVATVPPVTLEGDSISSSRVRQLLSEGNVQLATKLLGRPYMMEGAISKGNQLGQKLGFPTANLENYSQLIPKSGVYVGYAMLQKNPQVMHISKDAIPMVVNIGIRPTLIQQGRITIEAHFLAGDYAAESLYGNPLALYFTDYLREEKKFANQDELVNQVSKDIGKAKEKLGLQ